MSYDASALIDVPALLESCYTGALEKRYYEWALATGRVELTLNYMQARIHDEDFMEQMGKWNDFHRLTFLLFYVRRTMRGANRDIAEDRLLVFRALFDFEWHVACMEVNV